MNPIRKKNLKAALGGIWHETHAFSVAKTGLADFECFDGKNLIYAFSDTRSPLGGYIDWSRKNADVELAPAYFASAVPSGMVTQKTYETLAARLVEAMQQAAPDMILLDLHGAMVVENCRDVEADLVARLRRALGPVPIGAVLDFHANISAALVESIDIVAGYDTYPHTDHYERGIEVGALLHRVAHGEIRPTRAIAKPPLLTAPQAQYTDLPPMAELMRLAAELERQPGVLSITVAGGFPYSDVPHAGLGVVVTTDNDSALARELANQIAQEAWNRRENFAVRAVSPDEAVARVMQSTEFPVVLVDSADNIGGGAPGDGTAVLRALLDSHAQGAVISIADPEALLEIQHAGAGALVTVCVGGKTDTFHGASLSISAKVLRIACADFSYSGSYMTARRVHAGTAAVLDAGGVCVIVRERKVMPFDAEELRVLDIEPRNCRIIVVKSAIAWRAAYGAIAKQVIEVDAPGICSPRLASLPFKYIRRPIAPLDTSAVFNTDNKSERVALAAVSSLEGEGRRKALQAPAPPSNAG